MILLPFDTCNAYAKKETLKIIQIEIHSYGILYFSLLRIYRTAKLTYKGLMSKNITIAADPLATRKLTDILEQHEITNARLVSAETSSQADITLTETQNPVRIGKILDMITKGTQKQTELLIGPYVLLANDLTLHSKDKTIRLTEKERDILVYLYNQTTPTGKDELLKAIWGYNTELETHTLETHIYRLRQKIETDPSAPIILITEEDGYRLDKK